MSRCAAIVGTERNKKGTAMSELRDSLIKELGDIYDAEQQLASAAENGASSILDRAERSFGRTLARNRRTGRTPERSFREFGRAGEKQAMQGDAGLIAEAEQGIKDTDGDAALIAMAAKD